MLSKVQGVEAQEPDGAYYVFPDVSRLLGRKYRGEPVATDTRFAEILLEEFGVAVVQGTAFGRPGFLRLSFATSEPQIRGAMERFARFVAALD